MKLVGLKANGQSECPNQLGSTIWLAVQDSHGGPLSWPFNISIVFDHLNTRLEAIQIPKFMFLNIFLFE
jgi:hypothetical protein